MARRRLPPRPQPPDPQPGPRREYRVIVQPSARKSLAGLAVQKTRERIAGRVGSLAVDPRPVGVEPIEGSDKTYRVRVGDYRIVYD